MPAVLIGYDLNSPGQDYDDLITTIKSLGTWWHHLDSTWIVLTSLSVTQVRDRVGSQIDSGDELLVIDISGDSWAGTGFAPRAYDWLNRNL